MQNHHALVDQQGIVRNCIVWDGALFVPPKGYHMVQGRAGQIGDYWHQESNSFYTLNNTKRALSQDNKVIEIPLSAEEVEHIQPLLDKVFAGLRQENKST